MTETTAQAELRGKLRSIVLHLLRMPGVMHPDSDAPDRAVDALMKVVEPYEDAILESWEHEDDESGDRWCSHCDSYGVSSYLAAGRVRHRSSGHAEGCIVRQIQEARGDD